MPPFWADQLRGLIATYLCEGCNQGFDGRFENVATTVARLLTIREAATATGLQRWRLYEMLQRGEGPAHMRVGKTIRISESALVEWIESQHKRSSVGT